MPSSSRYATEQIVDTHVKRMSRSLKDVANGSFPMDLLGRV